MKISDNKIASLTYTLKNDDGAILDKADNESPFLYMHGTGGIIKGLEKALENKHLDKVNGQRTEEFLWKYSPENPDNINGYIKLIEEVLTN